MSYCETCGGNYGSSVTCPDCMATPQPPTAGADAANADAAYAKAAYDAAKAAAAYSKAAYDAANADAAYAKAKAAAEAYEATRDLPTRPGGGEG